MLHRASQTIIDLPLRQSLLSLMRCEVKIRTEAYRSERLFPVSLLVAGDLFDPWL